MRKLAGSAVFLALALAVLGAGCGGDDDGGSGAGATAGTTGPMGTTGAAGTAGATGGSGQGGAGATGRNSASGATGAGKKPNALELRMTEFRFIPPVVSTPPGQVTIKARNLGSVPHQLVLYKTNQPPSTLPLQGGRVDEQEIDGEDVLEIEDVAPRKSKQASVRLDPGRYVFFCNLPRHYQGGMHGSLTVR